MQHHGRFRIFRSWSCPHGWWRGCDQGMAHLIRVWLSCHVCGAFNAGCRGTLRPMHRMRGLLWPLPLPLLLLLPLPPPLQALWLEPFQERAHPFYSISRAVPWPILALHPTYSVASAPPQDRRPARYLHRPLCDDGQLLEVRSQRLRTESKDAPSRMALP